MRSMRTIGLSAAAAIVLAVSAASPASAQRGFGHGFHGGGFGGGFHGGFRGGGWRGGGWRHGGWGWGPAAAAGLAFGAIAAAPYYNDGYGYGCGQQVVGYDAYGQPVIADGCY
jgi:hypothetical protein